MEAMLTDVAAKAASGHYSLEHVTALHVVGMGLVSLGGVPGRCCNLVELDASQNALVNVDVMTMSHAPMPDPRPFGHLTSVNLTRNKISTLGWVAPLCCLERLLMAGNAIASLGELSHLTPLPRLRLVHLQTLDRSLRNPGKAPKYFLRFHLKHLTTLIPFRSSSLPHQLTPVLHCLLSLPLMSWTFTPGNLPLSLSLILAGLRSMYALGLLPNHPGRCPYPPNS